MDKSTSASWAMARRCKTAFVEPPKAITTVIAFSRACLVIISLGFIPKLIKLLTASPAALESSSFDAEIAS